MTPALIRLADELRLQTSGIPRDAELPEQEVDRLLEEKEKARKANRHPLSPEEAFAIREKKRLQTMHRNRRAKVRAKRAVNWSQQFGANKFS